MADRLGALIEYLEAQPSLSGIQIVAPRLTDRLARSMPTEGIVVYQMGGFGGALQGMSLYHQRVGLTVYGKTARGADTLHDKCMTALNNLDDFYSSSKEVWLYEAELESGAFDDLDTGSAGSSGTSKNAWPYVESSWGLMTSFD